jgi:hypothetical protein
MSKGQWEPCPGSGLPMIEGVYIVRAITDEDRAAHATRIERIERSRAELGDASPYWETEADRARALFEEWEADQGKPRTVAMCCVCQDTLVSATRDQKARRHKRHNGPEYTWSRANELVHQIGELQQELLRVQQGIARGES